MLGGRGRSIGTSGFSKINISTFPIPSQIVMNWVSLSCTRLCYSMIVVVVYWKQCRCAYIFLMVSSSSTLTFSTLFLTYFRMSSSIFTCLRCSSISLILASFSILWWYRFLTLFSIVVVKAVMAEAIDIGSSLAFSVTKVYVRNDIGLPLMIFTLIIFSCMILPMVL